MTVRLAASLAVLIALLAVPSLAGANPTVQVTTVSTTNLSRLPATVVHRLTLTAGAEDESVRVSAIASGPLVVGGSAVIDQPLTATGAPTKACVGRWQAFHEPFRAPTDSVVGFTIPAGTTAWVDATVTAEDRLYADEDLDVEFAIQPETGNAFTVGTDTADWNGPTTPEMSLRVLRGSGRSTVVAGTAEGVSRGVAEIWGYRPGSRRATRLKSVRVQNDGDFSWAGWRPRSGRWELYARYRTSPRGRVTGATECGTIVNVGR
jgi:hypothetical protein